MSVGQLTSAHSSAWSTSASAAADATISWISNCGTVAVGAARERRSPEGRDVDRSEVRSSYRKGSERNRPGLEPGTHHLRNIGVGVGPGFDHDKRPDEIGPPRRSEIRVRPAHRLADDDRWLSQPREHGNHVGDVGVSRVATGRLVARPVSALIERDDAPSRREPRRGFAPLDSRTGEAVDGGGREPRFRRSRHRRGRHRWNRL